MAEQLVPNILLREIDLGKKMVLFNLNKKEILELDKISSLAYKRLKENKSKACIVKEIHRLYNASREEIEKDMEELIATFINKGILVRQHGS